MWRIVFAAVALACGVASLPVIGKPPPADPVRAAAPKLEALGLPLTLLWPERTQAVLVFLSGDGGWQRLDDAFGQALRRQGVAVVGWSSFKYFWKRQSPERVSADLQRVVDLLAAADRPIFLGGYSFGAEMIPVTLATWPAAERARVDGLVLLAPSASASYQVDPLDWVRPPKVDPAHRVDDAIRRLGGIRVLCLTGDQDPESACPTLAHLPGVDVVTVPGDHHLRYDGDALAKVARERLLLGLP